tara:strand:+ start:2041 stop:2280 length:240 start_codon:yes stop_codon:yes gene_type:complete
MTSQNQNDVGSHVSNTPKNTSIDTNINTNATNTQVSNPTVPLILSLLACIAFGLSIIIAGYFKGNMHIEAVYHSLTNFV